MKSFIQSTKGLNALVGSGVTAAVSSYLPVDSTGLMRFIPPIIPDIIPTEIPGIKLWLKGDTIIGVDGSSILIWDDGSGVGNTLTAANGNAVLKTNYLNSKSIVRFTGQRMAAVAAVLASKTTFSCFLVFAPKATSIGILMEQGTSDFSMESPATLSSRFYVGNSGGALGPTDNVQNEWEICTVVANGITLTHYRNGIAGTPAAFTGNTSNNAFNLGSRSNNSFPSTCDIAELIIYDNDVGVNRVPIETYLRHRYGL